jgi:hypothetical protein
MFPCRHRSSSRTLPAMPFLTLGEALADRATEPWRAVA